MDVYPNGNDVEWPQDDEIEIEDLVDANSVIFCRVHGPADKVLPLSGTSWLTGGPVSWSLDTGESTLSSSVLVLMGPAASRKLYCNFQGPVPDWGKVVSFSAAAGEGGHAMASAFGGGSTVPFVGGATQVQNDPVMGLFPFSNPSFYAVADIGWGLYEAFTAGNHVGNGFYDGGASYFATFEKCPKLKLTVDVVDAPDGAGPECAGYCAADPARKFYSLPAYGFTPQLPANPDVVKIAAMPRSGYKFLHWQGSGTVYTSASGSSPNWQVNPGSARTLDDPDNPVTQDEIWVEMCNAEDRKKTAEIDMTAVFEPVGGIFTIYADAPDDNNLCNHIDYKTWDVGHTWWKIEYCGGVCMPNELKNLSKYTVNIDNKFFIDPTGFINKNNDVNILNTEIGFYPLTSVKFPEVEENPLFVLHDNYHENDIIESKQKYNIKYNDLLSGLRAVMQIFSDSDIKYNLFINNCTSVAVSIGKSSGVQLPDGIGCSEILQFGNICYENPANLCAQLNGVECYDHNY